MLFERLSSVIERKTTDVSALTWSELFPDFRSKSGVSVNVDSALRVTTVFACGRVLAEGVAQLPINFFDIDPVKGTKTKNVSHPAYRLLAKAPNDWMTSFELVETMMWHAVLTGNAYAYLGWGGDKLVEIIPLVPHSVQVIRNVDWTLEYIVSDLEGRTTTLKPENVLHLRGPSWNSYLGLESVQIARDAIGLAIATEETHASLHANGAQPGGVLSVKGRLDDKTRERLRQQWQSFQGSVGNRFKTAILDVDADWKQLSMSGVDAQHLETRRFQIEEICRAMRVFPQLVMHTDKTSTFASAEQFFLAHVTHSLMPWITRWEQTINRVILGDDSNTVCKFNVASLLRGDASQRANFYQSALGGARGETAYMTRNEVRELEDLNPIDGGDELLIAQPQPITPPPGKETSGPSNDVVKSMIDLLALKYNPDQPRDDHGRWGSGGAVVPVSQPSTDGSGGSSRIHAALAAAGGAAVIAARAVAKHLIASGAARALVRYGISKFGLPGIAAVAADIALEALWNHINKSADPANVVDALSDEEVDRIAHAIVDKLPPEKLQELVNGLTGSKGINLFDDSRFFADASDFELVNT